MIPSTAQQEPVKHELNFNTPHTPQVFPTGDSVRAPIGAKLLGVRKSSLITGTNAGLTATWFDNEQGYSYTVIPRKDPAK